MGSSSSLSTYSSVIFDFDGVIADTDTQRFSVLQELLGEYGYVLDDSEYREIVGKKTELFIREEFPDMSEDVFQRIMSEKKIKELERVDDYSLIDGVEQLITYFHDKRIPLGIVTTNTEAFVTELLRRKGLTSFFEVVLTCDDLGALKPAPSGYLRACQELNVSPQDTLIIEDSLNGILSGKQARGTVFAVATSLPPEKLDMADRVFADHKSILSFFGENIQ